MIGPIRARVRITLEIDAGRPWGEEATAHQIYSQARASAMRQLEDAVRDHRFRVVGEPEVEAVFVPVKS